MINKKLKPLLLQGILFTIAELISRRRFWSYFKEFYRNQWLDRDDITNIQTKKLKQIIQHAYKNTTFYNELLNNNNLKPSDITKIEDLKKIPITSKEDLRNSGLKKTSAKNHKKFKSYQDSTSGSTGEPFQFLMGSLDRDKSVALTLLGFDWAGCKAGESNISLWGKHSEGLLLKIFKLLLREKDISAFEIDTNFAKYVKIILKYKPKLIASYASAIVKFAKICEERGLKNLKIPSIITSAETLYPEHRELLKKIFSSEVFDRYGSRELGAIAHECHSHEGLHVFEESFIAEFEPFDKAFPELKKIIITSLDKHAMPFIRYDTGDLGILSEKDCSCGRKLLLIKKIYGRNTDFLKLKSGKIIPFLYFNYIFEQYGKYIQGFQIIQENWDNIKIKIKTTKEFKKEIELELAKKISAYLEEATITFEQVQSFDISASGKRVTVISKIKK